MGKAQPATWRLLLIKLAASVIVKCCRSLVGLSGIWSNCLRFAKRRTAHDLTWPVGQAVEITGVSQLQPQDLPCAVGVSGRSRLTHADFFFRPLAGAVAGRRGRGAKPWRSCSPPSWATRALPTRPASSPASSSESRFSSPRASRRMASAKRLSSVRTKSAYIWDNWSRPHRAACFTFAARLAVWMRERSVASSAKVVGGVQAPGAQAACILAGLSPHGKGKPGRARAVRRANLPHFACVPRFASSPPGRVADNAHILRERRMP